MWSSASWRRHSNVELTSRAVSQSRPIVRATLGVLLALFAAGPGSWARADEYVIDFWDAARGLPGNSAAAIAQTPEGYLWIGTYDGLARFDGMRFVKFDAVNTKAIQHSRIDRLFTDSSGTLWINTHDGSLTTWRNGVFKLEWTGRERVESAAWPSMLTREAQVFLLQSGSVLRREIVNGTAGAWSTLRPEGTRFSTIFCTTRDGALWIRTVDERLWRVVAGRIEPVALPDDFGRSIRLLTTDREGQAVLGTDVGMFRWNGEVFLPITPKAGKASLDFTFLHFTSDGDFWAIADGRLRKGRKDRFVLDLGPDRYLAEDVLQALKPVEDRKGGIWFAHGGRGLLHVDRNGVGRRFGPAEGFASDRVVGLFKDREDNVWVSVDRGGLARIRERRFEVVSVPNEAAAYATISVSEDQEGVVWIGSGGGGLARLRNSVLETVPLPRALRPFVVSLAPDGDKLWISADREDLWLLEKGVVKAAPAPVHGIKVILVDHERKVWMGRRDGLAQLSAGRVVEFGPAQGMGITDVRALAEDSSGDVWIGGGDGSMYKHREGRFERVDLSVADGVFPIWSLFAERDGTMWAGTYQGGLLRLKDGRLTRFTTKHGLISDIVCQIVDDQQGHLWLGSREGILRVSKQSLIAVAEGTLQTPSSSTYGRAEGIPPLECSGYQPGAWRSRSGRLWFATTRGAVSVSPADLLDNKVPPKVVVEEVWVDRVRREAAPQETVVVEAGHREVEFRFTGLSLSAPEAVRFRYRLQGLEEPWVDAGERRTAQYSYVPPGEYRFEVMARNSDGIWNDQGSQLLLSVRPHLWETWWFRTLALLTALALAAMAARHLTTQALRRNMARLEQQRAIEADRTRIAKDIHDDLGAGLTQISLLSELLRTDQPKEAKAHVEQIGETAAELTRAMDEIVWAVNPSEDTLESLWDYIIHFAQEYLGTAGIACRLDAPEVIPPLPLRAEVRHNVFLAVKEALHNVVKHAGAREVRLFLAGAPSGFEIEVQDDGLGLGTAQASDPRRTSSGHGLRNIEERMASVGAASTVSPSPSGGVSVRLRVPVR
jgi:signal transduction histidine kinase/ligand-binding sensor domain-containing protein